MDASALPLFSPALPEIVLAAGALALVLIGAVAGERATALINALALAVIALAMALVLIAPVDGPATFGGSFKLDAFARFMKVLAYIGAFAALALSFDYMKRERFARFEYAILVVLSTLGMSLMISASDLIALYLGLELQSLALYVIAAIHRDDVRSTEAGLKYFVLGALSSGMLLYGASMVYGATGAIGFADIAVALKDGHSSMALIFGLVFLLSGFAFKISAVPFHMWTPDVYEGAPTPITAFFASATKVAGVAMFVRVVSEAFPSAAIEWRQVVVFVSIASMALGSFAAIGQTNIKRLMAYSSIGHMGYALVGLAAGTSEGVSGVLIYVAIYVAMTLGAFACILSMRIGDAYVESIDDLSGLSRTNPAMAFVLAMILFSLAGIPPLAGFFAKFYVFYAAVNAGLAPLAVIGLVLSVIGAFYYLRIVKIIYFDEPKVAFAPMTAVATAVLTVAGGFTMLFFVYPAPLTAAAATAAQSLF
ncbi:NADH-quinone oxidoreductase subunit NuoN [Hansschlegelia plantiphila]|uniref:NADH-quinone oxidoreductase subunit N n=1 Tax=Hansschlegelia plantiphila TaxID=374655 RepID=A0A9W6J485_9HYPH|nr:NADH-quinone oxidoreductase subunit NuoN [Hansschlegelia plantiphila]GLK69501.1 NADH-quinone oxidoreductase subunit N [Hansschlegelia plantiphila]